jgi:hypothetical protein
VLEVAGVLVTLQLLKLVLRHAENPDRLAAVVQVGRVQDPFEPGRIVRGAPKPGTGMISTASTTFGSSRSMATPQVGHSVLGLSFMRYIFPHWFRVTLRSMAILVCLGLFTGIAMMWRGDSTGNDMLELAGGALILLTVLIAPFVLA